MTVVIREDIRAYGINEYMVRNREKWKGNIRPTLYGIKAKINKKSIEQSKFRDFARNRI